MQSDFVDYPNYVRLPVAFRENPNKIWFSSHLIVPLQLFLEKGPNEGDRTTSITTVPASPYEAVDARQFPTITEKMVHGFLLP